MKRSPADRRPDSGSGGAAVPAALPGEGRPGGPAGTGFPEEAGRPGSRIRLIATDMDGTLIGPGMDIDQLESFRRKLETLRADAGIQWVICTGRGLQSFSQIFVPFADMGIAPDFLITSHAYVFSRTRWGYLPHWIWNLKIRYVQTAQIATVRRTLRSAHRLLRRRFRLGRALRIDRDRLRVQFPDARSTAAAAEMLRGLTKLCPYLRVFEYLHEVDVRTVPFTKGLALEALATRLRLTPEDVLSIGDGHNDISMMDAHVAAAVGCPANAAPEVQEVVHNRRGHIARAQALAGVIETIDAHLTGTVSSELPPEWTHPSLMSNPSAVPRRHYRNVLRAVTSIALFAAVCYTVLLVFANFGLLPDSQRFMQPYRRLLRFVEALFAGAP